MPLAKPSRNSRYKQGYYDASQSTKYRGASKRVPYRSSYEYKFIVQYCEVNPNIVEWLYESLKIPYFGPAGKPHNYYMDFVIKYSNGDIYLIEVKPYTKTLPQNTAEYRQNTAKWDAAKKYASERKLHFQIVTEKTLNRLCI